MGVKGSHSPCRSLRVEPLRSFRLLRAQVRLWEDLGGGFSVQERIRKKSFAYF